MKFKQIVDWENAYSNADHIPGGLDYPQRWSEEALRFRDSASCDLDINYGYSEREVFDLFLPASKPLGLFVFVHGGYWVQFDKSYWSHFATGFIESNWAVAIPSYQLCPDTSIAVIQTQIARATEAAAARIAGPIVLGGHSAGGQLVSSMVCEGTALSPATINRVEHVLSVSGVHDLRPLLNTKLNDKLKLDMRSATDASPALRNPLPGTRLTALVGADERPEFIRQNALLANIWLGCGVRVNFVEVPAKHHFNVIDLLLDEKDRFLQFVMQ